MLLCYGGPLTIKKSIKFKMPARRCSCNCGRVVYNAFVRTGHSTLLDVDAEPLALWSTRCIGRLAEQRPELHAVLRRVLESRPSIGYGSGPRRTALLKAGAELPPLRRIAKKQRASPSSDEAFSAQQGKTSINH